MNENKYISDPYTVATYFNKISDITMNSIKMLYLETLKRIEPFWPIIYNNYCLSVLNGYTNLNGLIINGNIQSNNIYLLNYKIYDKKNYSIFSFDCL